MFLQLDPDDKHINQWASRMKFNLNFDNRHKVRLSVLGSENQSRPQQRNRDQPQGSEQRPPQQQGPAPIFGADHKPMINDLNDLLCSVVYFSNFPWKTNEQEIQTLFETAGRVRNVTMIRENEDHENEKKRGKFTGKGKIEFFRARDAHRAIILLNQSTLHERAINVLMSQVIYQNSK